MTDLDARTGVVGQADRLGEHLELGAHAGVVDLVGAGEVGPHAHDLDQPVRLGGTASCSIAVHSGRNDPPRPSPVSTLRWIRAGLPASAAARRTSSSAHGAGTERSTSARMHSASGAPGA